MVAALDIYTKTVEEYIANIEGEGKEWLAEMVAFMRENFPQSVEKASDDGVVYTLNKHYVCFASNSKQFEFKTNEHDALDTLCYLIPNAIPTQNGIAIDFEDVKVIWNIFDAVRDIAKIS